MSSKHGDSDHAQKVTRCESIISLHADIVQTLVFYFWNELFQSLVIHSLIIQSSQPSSCIVVQILEKVAELFLEDIVKGATDLAMGREQTDPRNGSIGVVGKQDLQQYLRSCKQHALLFPLWHKLVPFILPLPYHQAKPISDQTLHSFSVCVCVCVCIYFQKRIGT